MGWRFAGIIPNGFLKGTLNMYTTLTPAYGRDYKSAKAAKADWKAGKDFIIANIMHPYDGKPMSIRDAQPGESFMLRYNRLMKITKA
jgi:hypothetical protein